MNSSETNTKTGTPGRLLVMGWPDAPSKTDGNWYDLFFKMMMNNKSGFHKVGHAAIVVIDMNTGGINYFDFGRYLIPEGAGRARSIETDPDVAIQMKAKIENGQVKNMDEILKFLAFYKPLHGYGPLWATFPEEIISVEETIEYVRKYQERGDISYGPFTYKGSNCSRFICDVAENIFKNKKRVRHLNYPISLTPTPLGNIFSSSLGKSPIWKVSKDNIEIIPYQWHYPVLDMIKSLFTLNPPAPPHASPEGTLVAPKRVKNVPEAAQWLGGLGGGAWFYIQKIGKTSNENKYLIQRFAPDGAVEFERKFYCQKEGFDIAKSYQIEYNTNARWCHLKQDGTVFRFVSEAEAQLKGLLSAVKELELV